LSAAFVNPDGRIATVVMNPTDKEVGYFLWIAGNAAEISSSPHSIQTLVF
jgi:glucosylceramidase